MINIIIIIIILSYHFNVCMFDFIPQTPVIMLPRTSDSPEVLVAHLGRISIKNTPSDPGNSTFNDNPLPPVTPATEQVHIEIRDMSMYSVNLDMDRQKTLHQEVRV